MFWSHHRTAIENQFSNFSLVWLSLQILQFFFGFLVHLNSSQKNIYKNISGKTDPAGWCGNGKPPAVHNNKHDGSKCAWPLENIFNSFPWEMHVQGQLWLCLLSVCSESVWGFHKIDYFRPNKFMVLYVCIFVSASPRNS